MSSITHNQECHPENASKNANDPAFRQGPVGAFAEQGYQLQLDVRHGYESEGVVGSKLNSSSLP